ncbi:MAG: hypothetical protein ACI8PB_002898 [Desulforhopalus sp.]|jgi:hypothetical protein
MSEARDRALAQLTAATSDDAMGTMMKIGTKDISAVRRNLKVEEAAAFGGGMYVDDGLKIEGVRLTVDVAKLGYEPVNGALLIVDDKKYTIGLVQKIGNNRRITLTRFVS